MNIVHQTEQHRLGPVLRTFRGRFVFLSVLTLAAVGWATAQRPAAAQGTRMAVVDIDRIFREHPRLAQQREEFRRESESFQAFLQQEKNRMQKMSEQLKQFKPGTEAFRNLEKELASTEANLRVQMQLKTKEMGAREAKIVYQTYTEVVAIVARFCERNSISMVVRYSSRPIDPEDPRSIQAGLTRNLIYQRDLDITNHILAEIKQGIPPTGTMSSRPQIPQRR